MSIASRIRAISRGSQDALIAIANEQAESFGLETHTMTDERDSRWWVFKDGSMLCLRHNSEITVTPYRGNEEKFE